MVEVDFLTTFSIRIRLESSHQVVLENEWNVYGFEDLGQVNRLRSSLSEQRLTFYIHKEIVYIIILANLTLDLELA